MKDVAEVAWIRMISDVVKDAEEWYCEGYHLDELFENIKNATVMKIAMVNGWMALEKLKNCLHRMDCQQQARM